MVKYKAPNRWESIDPEMIINFTEAADLILYATNWKESDPGIS